MFGRKKRNAKKAVVKDEAALPKEDTLPEEEDDGDFSVMSVMTTLSAMSPLRILFKDTIAEYEDFFEHPELFERIHMHLIGVRVKDGAANESKNRPGLKHGITPLLISETIGENTGSTDFFPIGSNEFKKCFDKKRPNWDMKAIHVTKKGAECTSGLELKLYDGEAKDDRLYLKWIIPRSDFPESGGDWTEIVLDAPEDDEEGLDKFEGLELVLKLKVSDSTDKFQTKKDWKNFHKSTDTITYSEEVQTMEAESEEFNSLVQCWRHKVKAKRAVLWLIGRNDCFMHVHVAKKLFLDNGYDLYVLNYSCNGHCRKMGWIKRAFHVSHNSKGNFDIYIEQIEKAVALMKSHTDYEQTIAYSHSTGGPIFINYLIEKGDDYFDGFIFNSPFLDIGHVGAFTEFFVEKLIPLLTNLSIMSPDSEIGSPAGLKNPIEYLADSIAVNTFHAKLWSQHHFDFDVRAPYHLPRTAGFLKGVVGVQDKILKYKNNDEFILQNVHKPIIMITSKNDTTVESQEGLLRIDAVGLNRTEIELSHNNHDVFLCTDQSDMDLACRMVLEWMKTNNFA